MAENRTYIAIDLKSFFASVECRARGLDPLNTNLVVADSTRTEKTICLAVTPSLKSYGISGRARLFEVVSKVREVNTKRKKLINNKSFSGKSFTDSELKSNPYLELDYITAPPRMALYMEYSTRIYDIYLKYVSPDDVHVYSIDEVFIDVTGYLNTYKMTARELAMVMIKDVLKETGITATAGIATNMYLCKVALDIVAKHAKADENGVRIGELDEKSYRELLWNHKPITDFWRVGKGYAKKLAECGIYTMGEVARCSIGKPGDYYNEELLYSLFGINAELLIDHAWGYEPCTIEEVKAYRPSTNSLCSGQVLSCPYTAPKTRVVLTEMLEHLSLDLLDKGLVTDQIVLTIGYDTENLTNKAIASKYHGEVTTDNYGRKIPKHAHGTANLHIKTNSANVMTSKTLELFDNIINPDLLVRRISISANRIIYEEDVVETESYEQMDLFTDYKKIDEEKALEKENLKKEKRRQKAVLKIKKKYGKNSILKGTNFRDGATAIERNSQIGGHKA